MTEDWDTFFSDFAEDAALDGESGRVMIDEPDTLVQNGMILTSERTFVWPVGQWPTAAEGSVVTIGNRRFRFTEKPRADADGKIIRVPVKELR